MHEFTRRIAAALEKGTFIGLSFSNPLTRDERSPQRQTVRRVVLKQGERLQWTLEFPHQQTHENLTGEESVERAAALLCGVYRNAHLFTAGADIAARVTKSGDIRLTTSAPSRQPTEMAAEHNRRKASLIPEGTPIPFLQQQGVMTADGRVKSGKHRKFRQINRFLEFVEEIYDELPGEGPLEVTDFGCGLSYLTFALHHYLSVIKSRDARILGIDQNDAIIDRCRDTARECGLQNMEFHCGAIETLEDRPLHLAVSLHACDTATDGALAAAVRSQANVILAAPCCQHELSGLIDADALSLLTRHGILKERFAALATDALRAAVLERHGYRTQVIEFIDTEHTPKNLLIRAVRCRGPADRELPARIDALRQLIGVKVTRLDTLLEQSQ